MKLEVINFKCDVKDKRIVFPHFWEHTIGASHATMALRSDWQKQLSRCTKELGFKHVRFHGLLSDNMYTLVDQDNTYIYSFFNIDQICDFLLSIGMRPFMELSFMPAAISSGNKTVFSYKGNIDPPRDYKDWETLISKLIAHLVKRYGIDEVSKWFFEVWNEPNLKAFWDGSQADYFKLYQTTVTAIKKIDKTLKVGGPATANNEWITDFIVFCKKNNLPVDFISTHHYPTDSFGKPGDDTITQLSESKRSVLHDEAKNVKEQAEGKPIYYTEWSTSSNPFDGLHDEPYAAAFIIKTIMEASGIVEGYSYWTFSDIFDENYFSSIPFHGGFGLLNINGIPKPAYRAYELLHRLGNELLTVHGKHKTVDTWVTYKKKEINVLITNWALPRHPIHTEFIHLQLENIEEVKSVFIERIDHDHSNANKVWKDDGMKDTLNRDEVNMLEAASVLEKQSIRNTYKDKSISIEVFIPPQGIVFLTLEL
ncbi:MAG: glycosyl hydrolase [Bacteroidia bacterium]